MHVKNAADLFCFLLLLLFFFVFLGGGVFYQCEEYACMLHIILLRVHFSQNVKYWYEIRDVLVPIFHAL